MILLTYCCCCIPLNIACYVIAVLFIVNNIFNIAQYKLIFDNLGPDPNEDEENKAQRHRVLVADIIRTILALTVLFTSIVVIYATSQKITVLLKGAAAVVAAIEIFQYATHTFIFKTDTKDWLFTTLSLCVNIYFVLIWLSYALYLEDERVRSVSYVTVQDDGTGQQWVYSIPDGNRRYFHRGQYGQSPAPTSTMYPYPAQASASAYNTPNVPGTHSGQALRGQPPPPQGQRQEDYPFTPMPTPYGPGFWSK